MKTKLYLIMGMVLMMSMSVGLFGCKKNNNEPAPGPTVTIIKFKKTEYKNFILASYQQGDTVITFDMGANDCNGPIGKSGYLPYWDLPENWLLIDWKWKLPFPYTKDGTLLTELTWDKLEYPEISNEDSTYLMLWSLEEPHLFNPVEGVLYIDQSKLAKYNDPVELRPYWTNTDSACPCEFVKFTDERWTMFQQHLSTAIKNGDLDKLRP